MKYHFKERSYFVAAILFVVCLLVVAETTFAGSVNMSWTANAESDLAGYKVYYGTASRTYGTPSNVGNVTSYSLTGLSAGTWYFSVTAYDTSGNESVYSNEASIVVPADTTPPVISAVSSSSVTSTGATISWTTNEASDSQVEYGTTTGYGTSTPLVASPVTNHSVVLSGLQNVKLYHYRVKSKDPAGNLSASSDFTFTTLTMVSGLVAAYGFNEGTGTALSDASGNSNTGSLNGAAWTNSGKFGGALSFSGSGYATVNDSNSLDLTTSLTLEAWLYPTASLTNWATVLLKEQNSGLVYTLYAGSPSNRPSAYVVTSSEQGATGTTALSVNTWSHLATTYDDATLRLYVNGTQVASQAVSGNILASTGALRIGGNAVWGEYFQGRIDEVRIYNRALSQTEIQTDMNTAVGGAAPPRCDCNSDGATNALDLQAEVNAILANSSLAGFDINRDGSVNVLDLQVLGNVILGVTTCP